MPQKPEARLLAITAHDLRGAVGVLDGAMKELTREVSKDNADAAKLTSMMTRSAQRLLLLGDRLSTLGALMDGSDLDLGEPSDVVPLVRDAVNRAFAAHARRSLKLRFEASAVLAPLHAQSLAGAVSELTALFCSFSQQELVVRVTSSETNVRIRFESDNASESVQRALRDRSGTTQLSAGIAFAESVMACHAGALELAEASAAISLILPRHQEAAR